MNSRKSGMKSDSTAIQSEGAVGGVGETVGGPLSKEGAIGKHFTDSGAVGGIIHDTLGHGNATRKGN